MPKTSIRNAATVILVRDRKTSPKILMGQRGAKAAFMPNKFVFPGGAVDADDANVPLAHDLNSVCKARLIEQSEPSLANALITAAIREVWEETGIILGEKSDWPGPVPTEWQSFSDAGYLPSAKGFSLVFRAITPPGRPRRFDARFFMVDAGFSKTDLDDFGNACDELSHLQWIALKDIQDFDLPFITQVVMAEVAALIKSGNPPQAVPFFRNDDETSLFLRLNGQSLTSMLEQ